MASTSLPFPLLFPSPPPNPNPTKPPTRRLHPFPNGNGHRLSSTNTPRSVPVRAGIGAALMGTTTTTSAAAAARVSPVLRTLASNPTFVSGMAAWALAQSMKVFLNFFVERRWDLGMLCTSGGMPSSHTALCTGLTASVALCHGVADSLFAVCLGFSLIVMYDAIGVRRHAGMQAEVLRIRLRRGIAEA